MRATLLVAVAVATSAYAQEPALIPLPQEVRYQPGRVKISDLPLEVIPDVNLPAEGYKIRVTKSNVLIQFRDAAGCYYALKTLEQAKDSKGTVPLMSVTDYPRFAWRGLHLDVSRHMFSVAFIKKMLDTMSHFKMNVFHWHLTDDGGWRMESDVFPKLTSVGAWRVDTGGKWPGGEWNQGNLQFMLPGVPGNRYGGYYTKAEIRDVVRYAAERHITVVPEIELPGHQLGALVAYPQLGCEGVEPATVLGKSNTNVFCAGNEDSFRFLEIILDETMELFPSQWIHIGGDEVWKGHWAKCSRCQARMAAEKLKNVDELQSYFVKRIERFISRRGRKMIGWDEILEGGLAPRATVMSWRGVEGGIAAAKSKHEVVMTPTSHMYFDFPYSTTPTKHVYSFEPIPTTLSAEEGKYIIGVQGNLWTEWIATEEKLESMAFPRAIAVAEVGWTMPSRKNYDNFVQRLDALTPWLSNRNIAYSLPEVELGTSLKFISEGSSVRVQVPVRPYLVARYTEDGTDPTIESAKAGSFLLFKQPTKARVAYFAPNGRMGPVAELTVQKHSMTAVSGLKPGLWKEVFLADGLTKVNDFNTLPARSAAASQTIAIATMPQAENWAVRFTGYLRVPTTGKYTLHLTSDDGSVLKLSGATLIDNDGLHSKQTKSSTIELYKGDYPLIVEMFQATGAAHLIVEIEGPGLPRQPLDSKFVGYAPK